MFFYCFLGFFSCFLVFGSFLVRRGQPRGPVPATVGEREGEKKKVFVANNRVQIS